MDLCLFEENTIWNRELSIFSYLFPLKTQQESFTSWSFLPTPPWFYILLCFLPIHFRSSRPITLALLSLILSGDPNDRKDVWLQEGIDSFLVYSIFFPIILFSAESLEFSKLESDNKSTEHNSFLSFSCNGDKTQEKWNREGYDPPNYVLSFFKGVRIESFVFCLHVYQSFVFMKVKD